MNRHDKLESVRIGVTDFMNQIKLILSLSLFLLPIVPAEGQESKGLALPQKGTLSSIIFSPKGDRIAVQHLKSSPKEDRKIHLYDFPSLQYRGDLGTSLCAQQTQFSECGKFAAVNAQLEKIGALSVWDVQSKPPKKLRILVQKKLKVDIINGCLEDIRFSADGERILALDGFPTLHAWDWQTAEKATEEHPLAGKFLGSARFLTPDTFLCFSGKPEKPVAELFRFDGKKTTKWYEGHPKMLGCQISTNGKFAVGFKRSENRSTLVFDLGKPGMPVVDRLDDRWLPKIEGAEGEDGVRYYITASAMTLDRTLIIHYYEIVENRVPLEQGLGFFPRDQATATKFGLDLATHTHLFLPVPDRAVFPVSPYSPLLG